MPAEVLILDSTSVYFFILVLGVCIYCYFGDLTLKKKQNKTQIHPHSHNLQTNKFKEENRHHPRCVFKASVCKSSINLSSKFWQQVISHQRCYEGRSIASKNKSLMTWGVLLCNSRARGVPGIQWHLRKRWQRCLLLHQTATTHSTEPPSAIFSHLWPLFFFNMLWVGHFHVSTVQMSPMQAPRQVQHWPTPEQCIPWRGSKAALLLSCSSCQLPQPVLLPWLLLGNKEKITSPWWTSSTQTAGARLRQQVPMDLTSEEARHSGPGATANALPSLQHSSLILVFIYIFREQKVNS